MLKKEFTALTISSINIVNKGSSLQFNSVLLISVTLHWISCITFGKIQYVYSIICIRYAL